jgi:hypothetical protein
MRGGVYLCFSAPAGSSGSTSVYCQPTRAHRARAPAGIFRRHLRCSAPRTAPGSTTPCIPAPPSASAAGCRPNGAPCGAARVRRISPKEGAHDARPFAECTRTYIQRTPEHPRALAGQDARRARHRGWPFSWLLLFGHTKRSNPLARRPSGSSALLQERNEETPSPPTLLLKGQAYKRGTRAAST